MFSKSFVVVAACVFALSGVVSGAATPLRRSLDPSLCYALTQDFANYLDSTSSVLQLQNHPDFAALDRGNDKGVRFQFPQGDSGEVICQAHADHFVGVSGSGWSTDISAGSASLGSVHDNGDGTVFIQSGANFIGPNAEVTTTKTNFSLQQISCAKLG